MADEPGLTLDLRPTQETYEAFQQAYDHFNWQLFDALLPGCLITLQRKSRSRGFFAPGRFIRGDETRCDEIAMNPMHFQARSTEETLSTLVHEMVHLWQHHYGSPGRGRYHNRQWAEKMKSLGLHPSDTGGPDGREIGDQMSHYIIDGGPFDQQAKQLINAGFAITWQDSPPEVQIDGDGSEDPDSGGASRGPLAPNRKGSKSGKRVKYSCPACGLNAWSRHGAQFICGEDKLTMAPST